MIITRKRLEIGLRKAACLAPRLPSGHAPLRILKISAPKARRARSVRLLPDGCEEFDGLSERIATNAAGFAVPQAAIWRYHLALSSGAAPAAAPAVSPVHDPCAMRDHPSRVPRRATSRLRAHSHGCHRHRRRNRRHRYRVSVAGSRTPRLCGGTSRDRRARRNLPYGQGGALLPSPLDVWFGPTFLSANRSKQSGMLVKPGFDSTARDFLKQLNSLRDAEAFAAQYARLQPLIALSRRVIGEIEERLQLEYEQRQGMLHLFRHARDLDDAQAALDLLKRFEVPHRVLNPEQCVAAESSVPEDPAFAGGVLLPEERTANCPLFTKQLKQALEDDGVQFFMNRAVAQLRLEGARPAVELASPYDDKRRADIELIAADAIVVTAGVDTPALIAGIKGTPALYPLRVAGALLSVAKADKPLDATLARRALDLLGQSTHDWIPGAARVGRAAADFHRWPAGRRQDAASARVRQCGAWSGGLGPHLRLC